LMMSLWDALRMNMMISYQELVRTFPSSLKSLRLRIDLGLLRREAESPIFLTTLFFLFAIYFSFSFKGKHPEICF
ncbi:hypothetical protein P4I61_24435, partial [Escherichia coli]|uniref:hypothetical protein n=1 Tax=Escherichia coli TaxID=562 RepID=UPI003CE8914C